jgi:hypothetical protein
LSSRIKLSDNVQNDDITTSPDFLLGIKGEGLLLWKTKGCQ